MHVVRTASGHPITRVAFSPCGGWLAAAQPNHGVTLYDRAGAALRTFGSPRRPDWTGLTFVRGGDLLAVAGSKGMWVYATGTGETVSCYGPRSLPGHQLAARGDTLIGAGPTIVYELDYGGKPIQSRTGWTQYGVGPYHPDPAGRWALGERGGASPVVIDLVVGEAAGALRFGPSPARLASRGRLGLPSVAATCDYDAHLPRLTAQWAAHQPAVAFALTRVAVGDWDGLAVFDIPAAEPTGESIVPAPLPVVEPVFTLPPPDGWPHGKPWRPPLALTPDGRGLLVKRPRERVQLWDVDAGALAAEWSWRLDGITCLAVAPDGLTAVAGARFGRVLTWDLA